MKAIRINECGSANILTTVEIKEPTIKSSTEVKVKIKAAGVNPIDIKVRNNRELFDQFPFILGCDGAGIIKEVGNDVTNFNEGDEVYFFHGGVGSYNGNYTEYKVLDERFITHKPKSLNFIDAAASPLVLLTAWESLFKRTNVVKDNKVFINAGAGGVGHVAIQLAKKVGAKICTTISSDKKASFVKSLGADHIINYKKQNTVSEVMEWTDGNGVDVAMDNVGGKEIQALFPLIKHYGDMVTLLLPDNNVDWSIARFRNISFNMEIMLSPLLYKLKTAQKNQTNILKQCTKLFDKKELKIHVDKTFPLNEATKAHKLIESGDFMGKIVLVNN